MNVIRIICPGCGIELEADSDRETQCPRCPQRFIVPGAGSSPIPVAAHAPVPAPAEATGYAPNLDAVLQRRSTKVIRYSFMRTLGTTLGGAVCATLAITVGLAAGSGWVGWAFVGFGLLVAFGTVLEGRNIFRRRAVLVLCEEGLLDTREKGLLGFIPWAHIRHVSTFQFNMNTIATATTMVEVVKLEINDGIHEPRVRKIDVDNLNRRAAAIADLIVTHANQWRRVQSD